MSKAKKVEEKITRKSPPAKTPEAREKQLIALAVDVAEKQLRDGTASSQVIAHFLKLGSTKEKLEQEMMAQQNQLLKAKTEAIQSAKKVEELYINALNAMRTYSGNRRSEEDEDDREDDER